MIKRIVLAGLAGGITYFILGFLIYGMLLEATVMRPNMNEYAGLTKEMPDFVPLIIANLISGLLFAYILDLAGARTFASGAKIGHFVLLGIIAIPVLWSEVQRLQYALLRMVSFLDPGAAPAEVGYQLNQSLIAVGSGGATVGDVEPIAQVAYQAVQFLGNHLARKVLRRGSFSSTQDLKDKIKNKLD